MLGLARPGLARPGIYTGGRGAGEVAVQGRSGDLRRRGLTGEGGEGGGGGPPIERGLEGGKGRVPQLQMPGLALKSLT